MSNKGKAKPRPAVAKKAVQNHKKAQQKAGNQKPANQQKNNNNNQKKNNQQKAAKKQPINKGLDQKKYNQYLPTAKQLVRDTVRPEINTLKDQREQIDTSADRALRDLTSLYNRSVGDVNTTYNTAGSSIANHGTQINTTYDQAKNTVAAGDQAAVGAIQSNTSAQTAAVAAELAKLGIGQMSGDQIGAMAADGSFQSNIATQQGANNQANLGMQQASANSLTQMLGGMVQASRASNLGQLANSHTAGVNDINAQRRDDRADINNAIAELKAGRPGMIRDMLIQLQAQGFDQWQAVQALNLDRKQMNHAMSMDRVGMVEDSSYYGTAARNWGSTALAPAPGNSGGGNSGGNANRSWTSTNKKKAAKKKPKRVETYRGPAW